MKTTKKFKSKNQTIISKLKLIKLGTLNKKCPPSNIKLRNNKRKISWKSIRNSPKLAILHKCTCKILLKEEYFQTSLRISKINICKRSKLMKKRSFPTLRSLRNLELKKPKLPFNNKEIRWKNTEFREINVNNIVLISKCSKVIALS